MAPILPRPGNVQLRGLTDRVLVPHAPSTDYEAVGDVDKVIFPNGWVLDEAADRLSLYYGAGDSVVGLAEAHFSDLMEYMAHAPLCQHRRVDDDGRG